VGAARRFHEAFKIGRVNGPPQDAIGRAGPRAVSATLEHDKPHRTVQLALGPERVVGPDIRAVYEHSQLALSFCSGHDPGIR
jgi:hypothetical protein